MEILILEDSVTKRDVLEAYISSEFPGTDVSSVSTFKDYLREISSRKFDLIILDLVVPRMSQNEEPLDITSDLIEVTRDTHSKNLRTPGIALTSYDEKAEENFRALNSQDISVITYAPGSDAWKQSLHRKLIGARPLRRYDFIIVCAVPKEINGFSDAGISISDIRIVDGLECRNLSIGDREGVLVLAPRMGLVSSSITATLAIEAFRPQLVCMSGICAGVEGAANIYDVVIAETCYQHDAGKWFNGEFEPEIYSVSIEHQFGQKVKQLIGAPGFLTKISEGIVPLKNEYPTSTNSFSPRVFLAPCASGSAVIADAKIVELIQDHQRKVTTIEMESYALYESARLSRFKPHYVSAKTVVDDGVNKGKDYQRIGCILSARVVAELIRDFEFFSD